MGYNLGLVQNNLSIAWRFLIHDKWQTLFVCLGIGVGVAVQMFVGLLIDSLQANLIDRTVGSAAHISIGPIDDDQYIKNADKIVGRTNDFDEVLLSQRLVDMSAVVVAGDESEGAIIRGVEFEGGDLFGVSESIYEGRLPERYGEVVIGVGLAEKINVDIGDLIEINDGKGRSARQRIVGLFDVGVAAANDSWVVTQVETVQRMFGLGNLVNKVAIQIEDVFEADLLSSELSQVLGSDVSVSDWKQENAELLSALASQSGSSFMIQFFVLMSVVIAITSILSITVMQKQKQIGILKAMGLKNEDAMIIFVLSSFAVGLVGSLMGLGLGFVLFYGFINGTGSFEPVIRWGFVSATFVITVMAATTAGFIPARRSAKLDPIEIIQGD